MNPRQRYELRLLAEYASFDIANVAKDFSVSERSVRYDIEGLQDELRLIGEDPTALSVRQGIVSVRDSGSRWELLRLSGLKDSEFGSRPVSAQGRVLLLVCDLCWSEEYVTIKLLSEKYSVSRNTVMRDMAKVRAYCANFNINISSYRGKGVIAQASEANCRRCLSKAIRDYAALDSGLPLDTGDYSQWFQTKDLVVIKDIVREAEERSLLYLDDVSFEAIIIHIALALERYHANPFSTISVTDDAMPEESIAHRMAVWIVSKINEKFDIHLPNSEVDFIGLHIGVRSSEALAQATKPNAAVEFACLSLITAVGRSSCLNLSHDSRLFDSLLQHINAAIYRQRAGIVLENPLKRDLISEYHSLFTIIRDVVRESELAELIDTSEDELSYILLHFAVAMKRSAELSPIKPNIVVVCATGLGTAQLLATNITRYFDANIVATLPRHQLYGSELLPGVDLIVSTVPLQVSIPWIEVSPLLRQDDIDRVSVRLGELGLGGVRVALGEESNAAQEVMKNIQGHSAPGDEEGLYAALRCFLEKSQKIVQKGSYMLSELIEGHMMLDVECSDWEEAVRASGLPLVSSGEISDAYIEAVISNVKETGPYVVITKHIALPHATNKIGVNHTSMSFIRLKTPVCFGNEANDPVKYLFMLATLDSSSHLLALQSLAELLSESEFISLLGNAQSCKEILDYIKSFEENSTFVKQSRGGE